MNKFLQTIIFFTLTGAMIAFIFSALRPAQYLAESEFLVISNNIEVSCNKNLGAILAKVIASESFQENMINKDSEKYVLNNHLKIKEYKNTNVVNVKIWGSSLANTQKVSENVENIILTQGYRYYSLEDKIIIKSLINSKIIRTPRVIIESTIGGLFGGAILGLVVMFLTGLRLDIFQNNKNINTEKKKVQPQAKKTTHSSKKKDYTAIIKNRLEKELSKKPIENLVLANEEYVFTKETKHRRKLLVKNNKSEEIIAKKDSTEAIDLPARDIQRTSLKVRVIAVSTMIVGKHNKKIEKDKVPENLPVFIEKELEINNDGQEDVPVGISSSEQVNARNVNVKKEAQEKTAKKRAEDEIETGKKMTQMPGSKKVSAHDIANGFAIDTKDTDGPSNEEIKDRLNRLLRGEL